MEIHNHDTIVMALEGFFEDMLDRMDNLQNQIDELSSITTIPRLHVMCSYMAASLQAVNIRICKTTSFQNCRRMIRWF